MKVTKDLLEYGMNVIRRSLDLIRKGEWGSLEQKIKSELTKKFGEVSISTDEILFAAAEKLRNSILCYENIMAAGDIYKKLGFINVASKVYAEARKLENEVRKNMIEYHTEDVGFF